MHQKPRKIIFMMFFLFVFSCIYPSDMDDFYAVDRSVDVPMMVEYTEDYFRFLPSIAHVLVPIFTKDPIGIIQAINVAIFTTISTHSLKFALDDFTIFGTRLGRRPRGSDTQHNVPSGHSSMALCSLGFLVRRYGLKWLLFLPIVFLTLYARFNLDAHTISAIFAGSLLGLICVFIFASKKK